MMHMTMYWGTDLTLLFDWWTTDSWLAYSLSLLACFLFSLIYQFLESLRLLRFKPTSAAAAAAYLPSQQPPSEAPLLSKSGGGGRKHSLRRLAHAALFGVNAAIGYALMLAVMSFNGGVFLSVVLGISAGYYFFRCGDLVSESNDAVVENSCACS
ncbi:copper transporter 5-like [Rhododendron vialii]|uniref:copper transporter 5-like n=1 Tax=Rhododendron vialii TaxID=182163 RepID=UPI00265FDAEA|nr:copper transporter 5-like [Rhododendron vialii]